MPKTTTPLAKAWTTLEGILTTATGVAIAVASVPGLHALNTKFGAVCDAALVAAFALQRGLVKAAAVRNSPVVAAVVDSKDPLNEILKDVEAYGQPPAPGTGGSGPVPVVVTPVAVQATP